MKLLLVATVCIAAALAVDVEVSKIVEFQLSVHKWKNIYEETQKCSNAYKKFLLDSLTPFGIGQKLDGSKTNSELKRQF